MRFLQMNKSGKGHPLSFESFLSSKQQPEGIYDTIPKAKKNLIDLLNENMINKVHYLSKQSSRVAAKRVCIE